MHKALNLNRKRRQAKSRQRKSRGRPYLRWTLRAVLAVAPLLTSLVRLLTEVIKLFGK